MPAALYKRLNISEKELVDLVLNFYFKKEKSQSKIAKILGCHTTCIEDFFKKHGIKGRSTSEAGRITKRRNVSLGEKEKSVLAGLMLSDFHIERGKYQSRMSFGFEYKEFAENCAQETSSLNWSPVKKDKSTGCWHSKTQYFEDLNRWRDKWYNKKQRAVPEDIVLDRNCVLYWYLGDGFVCKNGYGAVLCSEAFTDEDVLFLSEKLNNIGIKSHLFNRKISNGVIKKRIRIEGKKGYLSLLEYIGDCPVDCYKYKWRYKYI